MITQSLLKKVTCSLLICKNDSYSTIVEADDAFYSMIGYTKEEMWKLHKNKFAELVIDDVNQILKKVAYSIKGTGILDYEFKIKDKLGRVISIHDIAVYDREEDVFNVVLMNINPTDKLIQNTSLVAYTDKNTGMLCCTTLKLAINYMFKDRSLNTNQEIYLIDLNSIKLFNYIKNHPIVDGPILL